MKESDLQKSIIDLLRIKGYLAVKFSSVGIYVKKTGHYIPQPQKGVSDILACSPTGRFIAIECKSKNSVPSEEQIYFLDEVKRRGGVAILAYQLEDVIKYIDAV